MAYTAANSSLNDWRKNSEVHRLAKTWAAPLVTLSLAAVVTQLPPPAPLNQSSMYFLATLMAAIAFWIMEVFDQHVVAFLLLLSWLFSGIVPSKVALAGFSENAWFFVIGAFAMGVSVNESGLLRRMGAALLSHIPPRRYKLLTFILFGSGFVATPLLPLGRARAVLLGTFNKSIFHTTGFKPCSNGSAGLGLSTFLASGQMSFMFLTGAAYGLAGWSLLPQSAKAEFGWLSWLIAALPAGIFSFLFLFAATHFVFPLTEEDRTHIANRFNGKQTETARPWSRNEWLSLVVVILSIVAWLSKPLHGIDESWVALAGMVAFLTSGVLDKKGFSSIDWGFLFFFAIVSSLGNIAMYLSVDKWLVSIMNPVFALFSFHPLPFLLVIVLVAFVVRLFLKKITAAVVSTIVLIPWATVMDIHPGVILLAILIGMESWFLPYQDDSYQLVYNTTEGRSFSHAQARKIMIAKFVSAFLAIGLSYPYWKALGYIN